MARETLALASALTLLMLSTTTIRAQTDSDSQGTDGQVAFQLDQQPDLTTDFRDPVVALQRIRQRREINQRRQRGDALFLRSPLTPLRDWTQSLEKDFYEWSNIKFGISGNDLMQGITNKLPGTNGYGMSSFYIFTGTWDGWHKGELCQGEITTSIEGRWNYGPPDPLTLGAAGLGTTLFTANPFTTYTPAFLVRNLFWRQGSREAGWRYRIGRVTPDQFLATSRHVAPLDTFLPIGTGSFVIALPDSGLGWIGGIYVNDWFNIAAVVHDANANRFNFGRLQEGDLFKALEFQVKLLPLTDNGGYSKVTLWHTDGTATGLPLNGSTGPEGWGVYIKAEQELTQDGRVVAVGRWGRSEKGSALYEKLAGTQLVCYDPLNSGRYDRMGFEADVVGIGFDWGRQTGAMRDESNINTFYRFPLFPDLDATFHYQAIFNPGMNPLSDFGSAISLRLRSTW